MRAIKTSASCTQTLEAAKATKPNTKETTIGKIRSIIAALVIKYRLTKSVLSDLHPMMNNTSMLNQINAIIELPDGTGTLRSRLHTFSWNTGLAHARLRTRYRHTLDHQIPAWTEKLHLAKTAHLYRLALDTNEKLPWVLDQ